MTGMDFGFDILIGLSLFFLVYIPFITIAFLSTINRFKINNELIRFLISIVLFSLFSFITLLIIRNFQTNSFKYLFLYLIILSVIVLFKNRVPKS